MRLSVCATARLLAGLLLFSCGTTETWAQDEFDIRFAVSEGDWAEDASWVDSTNSPAFQPSAAFEEGAYIGNGGTAIVDSSVEDAFNLSVPRGTIEFRPGGSLKITGSGNFARDATMGNQSNLIFTGNGSLDISQGLNSTGTIWLGSSDATLNVGGDLVLDGALRVDITAAGTPKITAGGAVQLGGTILANFDGVSPAFGDSYQILSGASSVASSAQVVLPETVVLDRGLSVGLSTTNNAASLTVGNIPVLTLNRASGAAKVSNVVGETFNVTGYSIASASGLLNPDGWQGLNAQGDPDWLPVPGRREQLSELNYVGQGALEVGASINLGNAYDGGPTHPRDEDVTFEIATAEGRIVQGIVEYEGPANDLVLNVNPDTGEATIQNFSAFIDPIDLTGYSITSASGALLPDNWTSFSDNGLSDWSEANPKSTSLAEVNLTGAKVFSNGTSMSLGSIFDPAGVRDLLLEFTTTDEFFVGTVEYGSGPVIVPGDCNGDGAVNAADLACVANIGDRDVVLAALGTLAGDLDGNGAVAFPDFLTLSNNFGRSDDVNYTLGDVDVNGSIAFPDFLTLSNNFGKTPGASAAAVPEPSAALLSLLGFMGLGALRRRRTLAPQTALPDAQKEPHGMFFRTSRISALCCGLAVVLFLQTVARGELNTANYISIDGTGSGDVEGDISGVGEVTLLDSDGGDMWDGGDNFIYLYDDSLVDGGFRATVRVVSQTEAIDGRWGKGGIRASADLTGNSANAMAQVAAGNGSQVDPPAIGEHSPVPVRLGGRTGNDGQGGFEDPILDSTGAEVPNNVFAASGANVSWLSLEYAPGNNAFTAGFAPDVNGEPGVWSFSAPRTNIANTGNGWYVGLAYSAHSDLDFTQVTRADGFHGITFDNYSIVEFDSLTPGDFNLDGVIDIADAMIQVQNFGTGTAFSQGDMNFDGVINLSDFLAFREVFGGQGATAAAVPEPGALTMLSLAGAALLTAGRRRRRR